MKDADDEFEDVNEAPLPGNSSYVPVPASQKTIKKNDPILPKQVEIEEEIDEDLEEYYDEEFD